MTTNSLAKTELRPPPTVEEKRKHLLAIPDAGRSMGMWVLASRGGGKSRLVGRAVVWQDFLRGIPTVVFDPIDGLIQNILDKIIRLPEEMQREAWERVRYVDCAGSPDGYVMPYPFLYPAASPYDAAQRFIELVKMTDPALVSASIQGFNALQQIGTDVGMVLSALNWQYTETDALLRNPRQYERQIREAQAIYPEIQGAADFLLMDYPQLSAREKNDLTSSFLRKIAPLTRNDVQKTTFAANQWGFSWDEVVEKGQLLLLDFERVPAKQKQLTLLWLFRSLIEWIELKRPSGYEQEPLSIVCDEITFMVNGVSEAFVHQFNQLVSITSRNKHLWITILNQEMNQLHEKLQESFITLGTQIYGSTTDVATARKVAERFHPYEPYRVKERVAEWASVTDEDIWGQRTHRDYIRSYRNVYFTIDEQTEMHSRKLLKQPGMTFYVGVSEKEGQIPNTLQRISIKTLDTGQFSDQTKHLQAEVKRRLMQRDGIPIADIRAEIEARLPDAARAIENRTTADQKGEQLRSRFQKLAPLQEAEEDG